MVTKTKGKKLNKKENKFDNKQELKKKKYIKKKKQQVLIFLKNKLAKKNIFYLIILILDITIIIYSARHNFANYVSINGTKSIFIGETKNLLIGRNYITLITTIFFFCYIALSNKILFKQKTTKKGLIYLLTFLLVLNISLFYIFTKRVY